MKRKDIRIKDLVPIKDSRKMAGVIKKVFKMSLKQRFKELKDTKKGISTLLKDTEYLKDKIEKLEHELSNEMAPRVRVQEDTGYYYSGNTTVGSGIVETQENVRIYADADTDGMSVKSEELRRNYAEMAMYQEKVSLEKNKAGEIAGVIKKMKKEKEGLDDRLKTYFTNFKRHTTVRGLYTDKFGSAFYISTKNVTRRIKFVKQYLGRFIFIITSGKMRAINYVFRSGESRNLDHPFIQNGNICYGNIQDEVNRHLKNGNVFMAFENVIRMMTSELEGNPYSNFAEWDRNKSEIEDRDSIVLKSSDEMNNVYGSRSFTGIAYDESVSANVFTDAEGASGHNHSVDAVGITAGSNIDDIPF